MSAKRGQLNLPGIVPIDMRTIKHRDKSSVIKSSNAFQNALAVIKHVKENGIAPYEGYNILTMEDLKKTDPELAKLSTAFFSFVQRLKEAIKENGVEKELVVVARGQNKVYLGNLQDEK